MIAASHFVGFLLAAAGATIVLATGQGTWASALVGFVVACLLVLGFGVPDVLGLSVTLPEPMLKLTATLLALTSVSTWTGTARWVAVGDATSGRTTT